MEKAKELEAAGVGRIDFVRAYYSDETTILSSEAFDTQGRLLPVDPVPPLAGVHGEYSQGFYSYSPTNHLVLEVGSLDWAASDPSDPAEPKPVPVLSRHYEELVTILTWQPDLPADVMHTYARHESSAVRKAVAANPNTPPEVMSLLATDSEKEVRKELAGNPALKREHFEQLSVDESSSVRFDVAKHPRAPLDILHALSRQTDSDVCRAALWNERFPFERLLELRNAPNATEDIHSLQFDWAKALLGLFIDLSESKDERVRAVMQENTNVPIDKVVDMIGDAKLSESSEAIWRSYAAYQTLIEKQLQEPIMTFAKPVDINSAIARHPDATPDMLDELSKHSDDRVRIHVTENENTSPLTLARLVLDGSLGVHGRAGTGLEDHDFSHREAEVRALFEAYTASPEDHIKALRALADNKNLSRNSYSAFPLDDGWVKLGLVRNPSIPPELLAFFVLDEEEINGHKIADLAKQR